MRAIKTTTISILAIGLLAGSAAGIVAQDNEASMAPSSFTGGFTGGQPDFSTDPETGLTLVVIPFEATDSRASGTWTFLQDGASIEDGEARYQVFSNSVRVENDRGTWVGTQFGLQTRLLPDGDDHSAVLYEFAGEGGYEGLTMLMSATASGDEAGFLGIIVPTDIIPSVPPPPPVAETGG